MVKHIQLPLTEELAKTLHAGDTVYLSGTIYTSRDAGHKRMCEALARGEKIPFDPTDATIYYVGPTPAKPGQVIGSAGPTTSGRMDAYAPTMMSVGARGIDILSQFLIQSILISITGGLIGVILGCGASFIIKSVAHWPVFIQPWSVLLSFAVCTFTGVFFGWYPAKKAADLDPIEAIRYE